MPPDQLTVVRATRFFSTLMCLHGTQLSHANNGKSLESAANFAVERVADFGLLWAAALGFMKQQL